MGNNRIKYLVKFVTEESHANDLLDGKLFMRPSRYFRSLESKNLDHSRGDQTEGAILQMPEEQQLTILEFFKMMTCQFFVHIPFTRMISQIIE